MKNDNLAFQTLSGLRDFFWFLCDFLDLFKQLVVGLAFYVNPELCSSLLYLGLWSYGFL